MKKRGQALIEAVIYILIALVLIGLVLSFVYPKIEEIQDKTIIEQSIAMMEDIKNTIIELRQGGPGNQRILELGIKKGTLQIDGENDLIIFSMEGKHTYSEPGRDYLQGDIIIHTTKQGELNIVTLTLDYSKENHNMTFNGRDDSKLLTRASIPYNLMFSNEGEDEGENIVIDISIK